MMIAEGELLCVLKIVSIDGSLSFVIFYLDNVKLKSVISSPLLGTRNLLPKDSSLRSE